MLFPFFNVILSTSKLAHFLHRFISKRQMQNFVYIWEKSLYI